MNLFIHNPHCNLGCDDYHSNVSKQHGRALADPAVGFGGGQLGEVTQARVPPKLKSPRIWSTIFWVVAKIKYKNKIYKKENNKSPASGPWFIMEVHG